MLNVIVKKIHGLGNQQGSLGRTNMETRKCRKCGTEKPIDDFQVGCITKGIKYRRHTCAICESLRKQYWYGENIERVRADQNKKAKLRYNGDKKKYKCQGAEWQRKYREEYREKVLNHYGNKCNCCGETTPQFLTIDHIHNDGYTARQKKQHPRDASSFYRWLVKTNFPEGFQILCMNCNFGKARNNGICPHQEPSTTISRESTA
ncbi:MAG: hypothetical protein KKF27_20315, partial [Gammaproteobacteria bacterium]|nr:hypothetical protein [Gammaproteobacteria bacterium]